jgi:hypothetical protein
MSEFTRKMCERGHGAAHMRAWLVCASTASALAMSACAHKPPTHITEVPIDQFQGATGPALVTGDPGGGPPEVAAPEPVSSAAPAGSAPQPLPTNTAPTPTAGAAPLPPYPAPGAHAKPAKALRLTAADCARLSDRYFLVLGTGQGLTVAQATKAAPGVKAQAQADPNFAAGEASCVSQNSRKQYACAMKTTTADAWKACLE